MGNPLYDEVRVYHELSTPELGRVVALHEPTGLEVHCETDERPTLAELVDRIERHLAAGLFTGRYVMDDRGRYRFSAAPDDEQADDG